MDGPTPDSTNTHGLMTERVEIMLPEPGDAAQLFSLVGGEDRRMVCATMLWDGPDEISEVEDWIERCRTAGYGEWGYHWVLRDRAGEIAGVPGIALGAIGTRPREEPGRADVGYWLGRPFWGRGVMGEVLAALLRFGFDELGFAKVEADVFTHNERGRRLVERLGMTHEGTIRRAHRKYGEWVDIALYGMLPEEAEGPLASE